MSRAAAETHARQLRHLLRRLSLPGALVREAEGEAVIAVAGHAETTHVAPAVLAFALARGWVGKGEDGACRLTREGRAHLERLTAPDAQANIEEREILAPDGVQRKVQVNTAESPLAWLRRRKGPDGRPMIDELAFAAGERLREDFTKAALAQRVTADWGMPVTAGPRGPARAELPLIALAARRRVEKAMAALGPGLGDIVMAVCCHLKGLEMAEGGLGWPQRSGKVVLQIALDRLARHYGMVSGTGRPGLTAWRAEEEEEDKNEN
ncbi:MAG: ATPase [Alphaproteobacteria bacterium]|nr:ATPase [Alphaproteobacteria bacterium]